MIISSAIFGHIIAVVAKNVKKLPYTVFTRHAEPPSVRSRFNRKNEDFTIHSGGSS